MNLGIEDAWVLARCLTGAGDCEYEKLRHGVVDRAVRRVEMLSSMVAGESSAARATRSVFLGGLMKIPALRRQMLETLAGLDHPLNLPEETVDQPSREGVVPIARE
jgi:2-polyprenyl-6-methoxyphenol hydroxylase-like FAD-dependent oxidoreductase